MDNNTIVIRGAREHNLRDVNLELPRNQLVVFTGVSGSGKSSLAFDTLYAEGQRRYVESLSSYARQFLGQMQKPDVDYLGGLSPAISIQQKAAGRNPRSTVGTITEIYDYLRVLYARVGQGHCSHCDRPIAAQSREQIIARILALPQGTRFLVLAPVIRGQKGEYKDLCDDMLRRGFIRARVDGKVVRLSDDLQLDRRMKHFIEIVVDRLKIEERPKKEGERLEFSLRARIAEAVEQALRLADGDLIIAVEKADARRNDDSSAGFDDILLSAHYACTHCDRSFEPPSPQLFSFNSPQGMCLDCDGLGTLFTFDPQLLIPDPSKSFYQGAIPIVGPLKGMGRWRKHIFNGVADTLGIDLKQPWEKMPEQHRSWLLHGAGDRHITYVWKMRGGNVWKHGGQWEGVVPQLMSSFKKTAAGPRRLQLEKYMRSLRCPACNGQRLNPQARHVRVGGKTLIEVCALTVGDLAAWMGEAEDSKPTKSRRRAKESNGTLESSFDPVQRTIAREVLKEIRGRLGFLLNVGLHYLTLERPAPSLSGGEAQRIRLAGQIGCGLVGVLYILDEPSIGLHPRDNDRLLESLQRLRDMGNTVLVVEHDEDTMRVADFLVDFGPGPGVRGGEVVSAGSFAEVVADPKSLTGQYLSGVKQIAIPEKRRPAGKAKLTVHGAQHHNLKGVNVPFPLGLFVCVTGVSGSGKSSLVNDILLEALKDANLRWQKNGVEEKAGDEENDEAGETEDRQSAIENRFKKITGTEHLDKVIAIDQSPIGRTPRSNPATYIKVFDEIRNLFAQLPEAKVRGYKPGRFSFNRPGGRCEACEGNGSNRLEMDFLADVWVTCPVCEGRRFNRETLQVRFKSKNIQEVLEMDVQEALEHFTNVPKVRDMLQTLHDVGMDYVKLGQPSPTLSGGEAQRIKLARELCKRSTGRTMYILDEPTTGLHFEDIQKLLAVLHGFVESGNTVVVIEHNLDVVKTADWLIDLGPEGGAGGGEVVCAGTPEAIAASKESYTGQALAPILDAEKRRRAAAGKKKTTRGHKVQIQKSAASISPSPRPRVAASQVDRLTVVGAQQHNLKNVTVELPREQMSVCCGPSGSGKSSLALDTIYAEGQRRYIESLSAYARQFLGQMQKPKVEHITGLSPAICIEQKSASKSPRSTVGTVTEIYDYLRVLYARMGKPFCPECQVPVGTQTSDEIIERILSYPEGTKLYLMAPVDRRGQEKYSALFDEIRRTGFMRLRVDGKSYTVEEPPDIDHRRKHLVEVVIDRLVIRGGQRTRVADAVETGLDLGRGLVHIALVDDIRDEADWKVERFSQHFACDKCGRSFEPLNPHHFSFNSPLGWCGACEGLGIQLGANVTLLIRDSKRSLRDGALAAWPELTPDNPFTQFAEALARHAGFALDTPFEELDPAQQRIILHGSGDAWIDAGRAGGVNPLDQEATNKKNPSTRKRKSDASEPALKFQYKGLFPAIDEASRVSYVYRHRLEHLVSEVACSTCGGSRLRGDAAAFRILTSAGTSNGAAEMSFGPTIGELCAQPLAETLRFFTELKLDRAHQRVAGELLREIKNRVKFLVDVGLDYLTLDRSAPTLSGGESQRIRLASQIGSGLTGVLYVLDEPTIGLHPRDNRRLLNALLHLRDLGNTLVLVEHDREIISNADYLLDFGPGAGDRGGEITARGTPKQVTRASTSLTGKYLSGANAIPVPTNRRPVNLDAALTIKGARHNNLKNIDVGFPLKTFVAITGVSGSGKSSLINDILYNTLARKLHRARTPAAGHDDIVGLEQIDKVINVDQAPIGNSPTSNPATYTGVFDLIRRLFAQLPESKVRGYQPRRFSFNKPGGRCEACEGNGQKKIEMHFLPDVWIECDVCQGARYNPETLAVRYKGRSINEVLELRVSEALDLFANIPKIRNVLQTLADVGLDYLSLGQSAPTLSGGEAQRVKLAAELSRPNTGKTLYILDEPTTGLHFDDLRKLLEVLNRLVDLGNTVVVVEHNLDVIKTADWVIDIGPEAGDSGGFIVTAGTPESVVEGEKRRRGDAENKKAKPNAVDGSIAASPLLRVSASSMPSHTAAILADVLKAGPHVERVVYDPHAAEREQIDDVDLDEFGKDVPMPWQVDGKRWHTRDRVAGKGVPCRWEGRILDWLDERIHKLGPFGDTSWNHRTQVEIAAPTKSHGWFLHASTGQEWLVWLTFRVGRNTFKEDDLISNLGIRPLNDTPGLEVYGTEERVRVDNLKGPWQAVTILAHRLSEIDTPAFADFLKKAAEAFQGNLKRLKTTPEDVMPWKVNGERWHLSEKGFPIGKSVRWDRSIVKDMVDLVRQVVPDVNIEWDHRSHIVLRVPGVSRSWGHVRTKESKGLDCAFLGRKGQFNLSQVEPFGVHPILHDRSDGTVLRLNFQNRDQLQPAKFKELLREQVQGFREAFTKSPTRH